MPEFKSILFPDAYASDETKDSREPACFQDLNLNQIVEAITKGRDEYALRPLFFKCLSDAGQITYRHEVMSDLGDAGVFAAVQAFSQKMQEMKADLKDFKRFHNKQQKQRSLLAAVKVYAAALQAFSQALDAHPPRSQGLLRFRGHLAQYLASEAFTSLYGEAQKVEKALDEVRYHVLISGFSVTVSRFENERDYSADVESTFARFQHGAAKDYRVQFSDSDELNHVETQILERVVQLYPEPFAALDRFCAKFEQFADRSFTDFDREIQFYIAYLEYIAPLRAAGLKFCFPSVSKRCRDIVSRGGFDLALATKLVAKETRLIGNDFQLSGAERILVVTGPNQGGKTTFARTFGQLHFLANLGCPVAGAEARLTLFDQILTHFEREEQIATLRSKLEDDLVRMREIMDHATPDSIVVINEIFASTSLKDAVWLGKKMIEQLSERDLLCVCVTFLDELASLNEKTVSMMATVVPDNLALRTFRIERKPANGLSYALALAEKHRLTHDQLQERLPV